MQSSAIAENNTAKTLAQMKAWVSGNISLLGTSIHRDALSVIASLEYINSIQGQEALRLHIRNSPYSLFDSNVRVPGLSEIPIHTEKAYGNTYFVKHLKNLAANVAGAYLSLKNDTTRKQFFSRMDGNCIEGRTSEALLYAAKISQNLQGFVDIMRVSYEKATIKFKYSGFGNLLTPVTNFILHNFEGTLCESDDTFCPEGIITRESVHNYLVNILCLTDDMNFDDEHVIHIESTSNTAFKHVNIILNQLPFLIDDDGTDEIISLINRIMELVDSLRSTLVSESAEMGVMMHALSNILVESISVDAALSQWIATQDIHKIFEVLKSKINNQIIEDGHRSVSCNAVLNTMKSSMILHNIRLECGYIDTMSTDQCIDFINDILITTKIISSDRKNAELVVRAERLIKELSIEVELSKDPTIAVETLKLKIIKTALLLADINSFKPINSQQTAEFETLAGEFRLFKSQPVRSAMIDFVKALPVKRP